MKRIFLIGLTLAIICGAYYFYKIEKRALMKVPAGAVSLEFPLKGGSFKAVQSGPNGSIHILPVEKYALDIIKPIKFGDFFRFRKADLEDDPNFGMPVYSPCAGNVTISVDGFPDTPIGIESTSDKSNHATINCGQFYVAMVHFKKDSILVKVGDTVSVGQQIALVGNSGKTSGPHLHIMAYRIGSGSDDKIALPITFNGKCLFRGDIYP